MNVFLILFDVFKKKKFFSFLHVFSDSFSFFSKKCFFSFLNVFSDFFHLVIFCFFLIFLLFFSSFSPSFTCLSFHFFLFFVFSCVSCFFTVSAMQLWLRKKLLADRAHPMHPGTLRRSRRARVEWRCLSVLDWHRWPINLPVFLHAVGDTRHSQSFSESSSTSSSSSSFGYTRAHRGEELNSHF